MAKKPYIKTDANGTIIPLDLEAETLGGKTLSQIENEIPTKTSDLTNDSGFLTSHQDISGKEDKSNKVTSFQTTPDNNHYPSEKLVKDNLDLKANRTELPTKVSQLQNDSNFITNANAQITESQVTNLPTDLQNIREVAEGKTRTYVIEAQSNITGTKNSDDEYTNVTAITGVTIANLKIGDNVLIKALNVPDYWVSQLNKSGGVTTSVSLNKLETTKVIVPTVNNATLTIQKNGTTIATFTANSSTNQTANISVPTALSDLTQSASYRTVTDTEKTTWNNKANADTGATSVEVTGSGNAVTSASYSATNRKLTLTKGTTFLTSHQDISGKLDKSGGTMSGKITFNKVKNAIAYTGTKATYDMIKFIDNTGDTYGNGISIGGGGKVVVGAGESQALYETDGGDENLYLTADSEIYLKKNCQSGDASCYTVTLPNKSGTMALTSDIPTFTYDGDNKPDGHAMKIDNMLVEGGRYYDWHYDNTTGSDYSCRLEIQGNYSNTVKLPTASGVLALTSDIPTIPTSDSDLTNNRYVRFDTASQGLTSTQKSNARTNIGAGTVTSVRVQAGTGLSSSTSTAQTSSLNTTISIASGYKLPTTTEWNNKANSTDIPHLYQHNIAITDDYYEGDINFIVYSSTSSKINSISAVQLVLANAGAVCTVGDYGNIRNYFYPACGGETTYNAFLAGICCIRNTNDFAILAVDPQRGEANVIKFTGNNIGIVNDTVLTIF